LYSRANKQEVFIEINGRGRHTNESAKQKTKGKNGFRATTYEVDLIKVNLAQQNGYTVFQYTYPMLLARVYKNNF